MTSLFFYDWTTRYNATGIFVAHKLAKRPTCSPEARLRHPIYFISADSQNAATNLARDLTNPDPESTLLAMAAVTIVE